MMEQIRVPIIYLFLFFHITMKNFIFIKILFLIIYLINNNGNITIIRWSLELLTMGQIAMSDDQKKFWALKLLTSKK